MRCPRYCRRASVTSHTGTAQDRARKVRASFARGAHAQASALHTSSVVSSLPFVFFFFCFTTLVLFFFTAPRDFGILARACTRASWRSALFPRLARWAPRRDAVQGASPPLPSGCPPQGSRLHEAAPWRAAVSGQGAQLMPQRSGGGSMYTSPAPHPLPWEEDRELRTCQ